MTTTVHPKTEIVADDTVPLIRITREFDAPPAKVFEAHTDPDLLGRWIGPHDLSTVVDRWDCRTGGSWAFHQTRGDDTFAFYGSFHEVRPCELIVQTFTFTGYPDVVSLERLVLEDLGEGRSRLVATSIVDSFEARNAILASGMDVGVTEAYEALDDLLASTAS
ncbi:MAG: SRPBCC family protein [Acidimicrobiia bacterium]